MIYVNKDTRIPSVTEAKDILILNNNKMGIPLDYDRLLEYYSYYTIKGNELKDRVKRYCNYTSQTGKFTDSVMLGYLTKMGVTTGFLPTKGGGKSLSSDSIDAIIATGLYNEEICTLLKVYKQSKKCLKKVDALYNIIDSHSIAKASTYDNHRMIFIHPTWVEQNTGRLGMQNPALMNISKELADIQTVPKGWVILEVDSGQIEPRIIQSYYLNDDQLKKCTLMYNDAYFGYIHYCNFLTEEQRRTKALNIEPVELSKEIVDKRKRFKTYGNAVMYGSTSNIDNDPDKDKFIKYIGGHPNRVAWTANIERQIDNGVRVFETAFGTPIDITAGPSEYLYSDKNSDAYRSHLIRCAINNPIQGTAADLMRLSIRKANNLLLRNAPNSVILKYTHDSGTFAIHENDYDKVIDDLKGITSYQVMDWIPIYGDPVEGISQSGELPRLV